MVLSIPWGCSGCISCLDPAGWPSQEEIPCCSFSLCLVYCFSLQHNNAKPWEYRRASIILRNLDSKTPSAKPGLFSFWWKDSPNQFTPLTSAQSFCSTPRLRSIFGAVRKTWALPWPASGLAVRTSYAGSRSQPGDMAKQVMTCMGAKSRNFSFL